MNAHEQPLPRRHHFHNGDTGNVGLLGSNDGDTYHSCQQILAFLADVTAQRGQHGLELSYEAKGGLCEILMQVERAMRAQAKLVDEYNDRVEAAWKAAGLEYSATHAGVRHDDQA